MSKIDHNTETSLVSMRAAIERSRLSAGERAEALVALHASETIADFLFRVFGPSGAARNVSAKGGTLKPRRPAVEV